MKRILTTLIIASMSALLCNATVTPVTSWKLSGESLKGSIDVTTPSTVAAALADNGKLGPDLMEGENYFKVDKSIFDTPWTYTAKQRISRKNGRHCLLRFNSLGFYADIRFNGTLIASSDTTLGVFTVREYDVTPLLRTLRRNKIEVTLRRAQPGDLNIGFVDWNPRAIGESMGILGDVTLIQTDAVVIDDVFVRPELDTESLSSADLEIKVSVRNVTQSPVEGNLRISYEGGECIVPVSLGAAESKVLCLGPADCAAFHIDNPRIWWTWDLGTPELYEMAASFEAEGTVNAGRNVKFGVRSITSKVNDNHLQFYLNGRPVLIKGAGWTDELLLRDTHESNTLQAEYVKDMNMNCIRFENVWCKDDNIYDVCDSLGLLVMVGWSCQWEWQDYCGLPETDGYGCINDERSMNMAVEYFYHQVRRLHNHPSIICWLTGSDRIPNPELELRYMEIYREWEDRPYVCSAKDITSLYGGPSGTKMAGPYEYEAPDYWYLDKDNGGAFGFNTETGIGMNIPQLPSLKKMIPADSLWPLSRTWDLHCTASSSAMNSTKEIVKAVEGQFGAPATLEEFVNRAHALDYDGTRSMYEAFRCNIPVSTGIIQWMLNSAWPSLYWQQYDYYMLPVAAYYGTRKACQSLQLIYNYADKCVYAVNESGSDRELEARIRIYDESSALVSDVTVPVLSKDNTPVKVSQLPASDKGRFLALELLSSGDVIADNFYCVAAKNNVYDWEDYDWYITYIKEFSDLRYVANLPEASVKMTVTREQDGYKVELANESDVISYQNILRVVDSEGNAIVPAFWSDNFVTVLPGQTKTLTCKAAAGYSIETQTWNTNIL